MLGARIRLDFDDGPVDLTFRSPNIVHWEPTHHDDAVLGFYNALAIDAAPPENLVTLAPHDHARWYWSVSLGEDVVARLFAKKMLVESTTLPRARSRGSPSDSVRGAKVRSRSSSCRAG